MAESVDALVSNTSRFTPVPVRPRLWVLKTLVEAILRGFLLFKTSKMVAFGHHLHYDDILNFQENSLFLEIDIILLLTSKNSPLFLEIEWNTKRDVA